MSEPDLDLGFTNAGRWGVLIGVEDVPHIGPEERKRLEAAYSPAERSARLSGIPALGSGAVFPIAEDDITCRPFEIPAWYRRAYGMDVGWNFTAIVFGAYNPENDTLFFVDEIYRSQCEPSIIAAAIKARGGSWQPGAIDPASRGRSQVDGRQLLTLYTELGLRLTPADNGLESGLFRVWERLSTGRLKVFSTLQHWLREYRLYRRDERGRVVATMNHAQDAGRYLTVSGIEIATVKPATQWSNRKPNHTYDYDPMQSLWQRPRR
jgi:hypothetical protein